jgi:hypothetical protein
MKCAVMKKMNGIVDPISLGFILTAMIAGAGVTTASNIIEESNITKVKIESEKNVMVKNAIKPIQQYLIYSDTTK